MSALDKTEIVLVILVGLALIFLSYQAATT